MAEPNTTDYDLLTAARIVRDVDELELPGADMVILPRLRLQVEIARAIATERQRIAVLIGGVELRRLTTIRAGMAHEADESGQDIEGANIWADADDLHRMTLIAESPIYAELFEQYGKKGSQ